MHWNPFTFNEKKFHEKLTAFEAWAHKIINGPPIGLYDWDKKR